MRIINSIDHAWPIFLIRVEVQNIRIFRSSAVSLSGNPFALSSPANPVRRLCSRGWYRESLNTSLLPNQVGWLFLPFSANQICRRKYLPLLHISKKSSNFAPKFVYARK